MPPFFDQALRLTWLAVIAYWIFAARSAKPTEMQEPFAIRVMAYWLPLVFGVLLLGPGDWFGRSWLREQFVPHVTAVYVIGLALAMAGAALAIGSRAMLGRNWSATVELKQGHELITRGPYRVVRHPIYTGLLLLFLGNAVMVGDWRGLFAVTIVFASFWRKLKVEETWLARRFGAAYQQYQARTKALIPAVL
jgi:protein-S-isoprenylcysteine O-methyltransferase Ste14